MKEVRKAKDDAVKLMVFWLLSLFVPIFVILGFPRWGVTAQGMVYLFAVVPLVWATLLLVRRIGDAANRATIQTIQRRMNSGVVLVWFIANLSPRFPYHPDEMIFGFPYPILSILLQGFHRPETIPLFDLSSVAANLWGLGALLFVANSAILVGIRIQQNDRARKKGESAMVPIRSSWTSKGDAEEVPRPSDLVKKMKFRIEALQPDQWETFRSVRLKALGDTPDAFGSTYEREIEFVEDDWKRRLERPDCATFVALTNDSTTVGLIVAAPYNDHAGLFAMWVDSTERRKGIGSELIDAVIHWAHENDFRKILLDVADENSAAIFLYESKGFTRTGVTGTLPPPREHILEHQRCLSLNLAGC